MAPTQEILDDFKKRGGDWTLYERRFLALMAERRIEHALDPDAFKSRTVLLCSEPTPDRCHRALVCDYLGAQWPGLRAVHL